MCPCDQFVLRRAVYIRAVWPEMLFTQCNVQSSLPVFFLRVSKSYDAICWSVILLFVPVSPQCPQLSASTFTETSTSIAKKGLTYQKLRLLKLKCLQHHGFMLTSTANDQIVFHSCGTSVPPVCSWSYYPCNAAADRQVATGPLQSTLIEIDTFLYYIGMQPRAHFPFSLILVQNKTSFVIIK